MDIINENVEHPQKVEVVNSASLPGGSQSSPMVVVPTPELLVNNGSDIKVVDEGSHINEVYVHPVGTNKNLVINCVQILESGIGYFVPYNFVLYNHNDTKIQEVLASIYNQLASKYTTAEINIFYSTQSANRSYTFSLYTPI